MSRKSRFKFPREEPTLSDWVPWEQFWRDHTGHGYILAIPLGKWLHLTHQQWQWFYDAHHQLVTKHIDGSSVHAYKLSTRLRASRLATTFTQTPELDNAPIPMRGDPTSVITLSESTVKKLQEGPPLAKAVETHLSFWDHLDSWGGAWMWSDIPRDQSTYTDTSWLATRLSAGTLIWVTDGSYDRKRGSMGGRMDHSMHPNKTALNRNVLGEQPISEFLQGRDAWPLCHAHSSSGHTRVLPPTLLVCHSMLQQQESTRHVTFPLPQDQTKR